MKQTLYLYMIILLISCKQDTSQSTWHVVYKNNKQGNTISGSKQELISAIRAGSDIKIGWGSKGKNHSIEHLSNPIWLAVLDEKEVVAHLDPQVLSNINWETLSATYKDSLKLREEWRVVITTKGEFDAIWYDKKHDSLIKRRPQNHNITWFSNYNNKDIKPLFSE